MTIRTKISLGLGFMFVIILGLGGLGAYYLNQLDRDSRSILKDNYISLQYVSDMQKALLDRTTDPDAINRFDQLLHKQEANVTEEGEQEVTDALSREFSRLKVNQIDTVALSKIQSNLLQLDDINRQAMFRKNTTAEQTAKDALLLLAVVGTFCFLILFSFISLMVAIISASFISGFLRLSSFIKSKKLVSTCMYQPLSGCSIT